jgi:hypothetical protein
MNMKRTKTHDLTGSALEWAVAKCEGYEDKDFCLDDKYFRDEDDVWYSPSTDWSQGGPIIEREGIALYLYGGSEWNAHVGGRESVGPTPLIAAMRCYVASKLGDEIEIPEEIAPCNT